LALRFASVALQNDRDIAMAAITQDGHALQYVPAALTGNRKVVLAAVLHAGDAALQHASNAVRVDSEVVHISNTP
jgi:hypothetical protein